jgi:hypothetical protein
MTWVTKIHRGHILVVEEKEKNMDNGIRFPSLEQADEYCEQLNMADHEYEALLDAMGIPPVDG